MMNLVRRRDSEVEHPVRTLQREMDRLFRGVFDDEGTNGGSGGWPQVDLTEKPDAFVLRAEMPGMDAKDIDIQLSGDLLTITGEKRDETVEDGQNRHFTERRYGQFYRAFRLPTSADPGRIEAKMNSGILNLTIGKRPESRPQTIKIKPA